MQTKKTLLTRSDAESTWPIPLSKLTIIAALAAICHLSPSNTIADEERCAKMQAKTLAVTEIVEHQSLANSFKGTLDVLAENCYKQDENLTIIHKNAQGNIAISGAIAKQFISLAPDAILAISTPSAQTMLQGSKNTEIPLVFSSVADPITAGLVKDLAKNTGRVTGAIDFPPLEMTIPLIKSILPEAKKVGLLYNAGEANSVQTVEMLKKLLVESGYTYKISTVANSSQIMQGFAALKEDVDIIYIPSDNIVYAAMSSLVRLSRKHKMPIISSDPDSVEQGVLACVGYNQYQVGRMAGYKLLKILAGERDVSISAPAQADIYFNSITAEILGIQAPEKVDGIEVNIF